MAERQKLSEQPNHIYAAIDLKSFYASVECQARHLDPMTTNLVVADESRTEKTICLAVSPSLKAYGIPGRARLFEVIQRVREINRERLARAIHLGAAVPGSDGKLTFSGSSCDADELASHPGWKLAFITAVPRMQTYMDTSTAIYNVYLRHIAPEDIYVYSIDEVFIDVTGYLNLYHMTARELAAAMIRDILAATGITATCGIGTNLYLAKAAMDILAKHEEPDASGVRIAELDETGYRRRLWTHTPLTDFWRVGSGTARKLAEMGIFTMGDIARCSLGGPRDFYNEDRLYDAFGVNAELLIDHAWGWEPVTLPEIKAYRPENSSLSSGQVLHCPYPWDKARLVVREMLDLLALDLVEKHLVIDQLVLTIGYDRENLEKGSYRGEIVTDRYGRRIPKHAHGTVNLDRFTSSGRILMDQGAALYDRITDRNLMIRHINIAANHVIPEAEAPDPHANEQMSLFVDYAAEEAASKEEDARLAQERKLQEAMLNIKKKFGKNAVLRGMNLEEGATARDRNRDIGGHKA